MSDTKKTSRWGLYLPFILFGLLFGAYAIYWFYVAGEVRKGVDEWVQTQRAMGNEVEYSRADVTGFPYRLALHVDDPVIVSADSGWAWKGERLQLLAMPWNLNRIMGRTPGENEFLSPAGARYTALLDDQANLAMTFTNGDLTDIDLVMKGGELRSETETLVSLKGVVFNLRPMPEREDNLQISLQAGNINMVQSPPDAPWLGPTLDRVVLFAEVTNFYSSLDAPDTMASWMAGDGTFDVRRAELAWGPLDLGAKGKVGLDAEGYPDGLLQVRIDRADELLASLAAADALTDELRVSINSLKLMSQNNGFAAFRLDDGGLFLLTEKLADLPQVASVRR